MSAKQCNIETTAKTWLWPIE